MISIEYFYEGKIHVEHGWNIKWDEGEGSIVRFPNLLFGTRLVPAKNMMIILFYLIIETINDNVLYLLLPPLHAQFSFAGTQKSGERSIKSCSKPGGGGHFYFFAQTGCGQGPQYQYMQFSAAIYLFFYKHMSRKRHLRWM